ncbi:4'-phosphopantetheinyl transferase family protein [Algoriphagus sediminis]|uniref:4'-phosphopantetheinyl transferase superfamily protein n=1 Tax=Algoriphagus sediminis TaxID=3057113 RepID=A0ABT7Y827_9BACT|nr:4'-phosphopantetheinyl transferase superfamily protein [Algoriphagus sediminis]MDN3202666.1 4'-phosphopantetheinyl transferase superfamily protein [Algoriphagus sediminis]
MQTKIEKINASSALSIKIIDEHFEEDLSFLSFREKLAMANISHPEKRLEWVSSRRAIYEATEALGIEYPGFYKDAHGKSQAMNNKGHVSLSHTKGIATAIYHDTKPVGIDLELIREKVVRIGPRFLAKEELDFLTADPEHVTMAWSAKESVFKCLGKRGVSFRNHIRLSPFNLDSIFIKAKVDKYDFDIQVSKMENLILTYTIS